jgi:hypothetical protein
VGTLLSNNLSDTLAGVDATINYLADPPSSNPSRWLQYYVNDKSRTTMRSTPHAVRIQDARPINAELDLDREGFKLFAHKSAVSNFRDAAEVERHQPAELESLIRTLTGASATFGVGPSLRFAPGNPESDRDIRVSRGVDTHPAGFAHGDFTSEGIHWMAEGWPGLRLDAYSRYACYNVWRVITPPPQNFPLALCDARTVALTDAVDAMAVMDPPQPNGQVYRAMTTAFKANPAHRWYYFRDMTLDEVIIFKSYDSDTSRASNIPHSAFRDATCPLNALPRASAETRVIAVFK